MLLAFYFHLFLQKDTSTYEWFKVDSFNNLTSMHSISSRVDLAYSSICNFSLCFTAHIFLDGFNLKYSSFHGKQWLGIVIKKTPMLSFNVVTVFSRIWGFMLLNSAVNIEQLKVTRD